MKKLKKQYVISFAQLEVMPQNHKKMQFSGMFLIEICTDAENIKWQKVYILTTHL